MKKLLLLALFLLAGCASAPNEVDTTPISQTTQPPVSSVTEVPKTTIQEPSTTVAPTTATTATPTTETTYVAPYVPPTTLYVPPPAPPASTAPPVGTAGSGCVIPQYICQRESGGNYGAVNPSSGAGGLYQIMPSTWNAVAGQIGRPDLIGTPPQYAAPSDQDAIATALWAGGNGCSHWSAC